MKALRGIDFTKYALSTIIYYCVIVVKWLRKRPCKFPKQVAQRAMIAHLSPMCQGKILFKKTTEKKWKHHFPHYKSMGGFLRRSRAANSLVGGLTWPKFELIHNIMHVLVTSKFEKRSDQHQRRLRDDIDFLDAQGQLTP